MLYKVMAKGGEAVPGRAAAQAVGIPADNPQTPATIFHHGAGTMNRTRIT